MRLYSRGKKNYKKCILFQEMPHYSHIDAFKMSKVSREFLFDYTFNERVLNIDDRTF